jgi:hypothetical protein
MRCVFHIAADYRLWFVTLMKCSAPTSRARARAILEAWANINR